MAFDTQLRDETGRVVATLWTGNERSYVLPDGGRCAVPQALAWCHNCVTYVAAQEVPALEHVEQRLAALSAGREAYLEFARSAGELETEPEDWTTEDWKDHQELGLKYWEGVRSWRLLRRAPPRCHECFSTEVELIPDSVEYTFHPRTRHRLTLHTTCHMTMSRRWKYEPDGLPFETTRE